MAVLQGAVAGYLLDDESEPTTVLLGVAAAFPSAEWDYFRWVPAAQQGAAPARLRGPTQVEVHLSGRPTARRLELTRGARQGFPASGTVWALLYDPFARFLWGAVPRRDLWPTVFADDIAVALRSVLLVLRIVRRALDVVSAATGFRLKPCKCGVVGFMRRPRRVVQDIACDGAGVLVRRVFGRYLGFGPGVLRAALGGRSCQGSFSGGTCPVIAVALLRESADGQGLFQW